LPTAKNFLVAKNGNLILKGRKGKLSPEDIEIVKKNKEVVQFIITHKNALLDYLAQKGKVDMSDDVLAMYELSPLQEGMLFHGLLKEDSKSYVEQYCFDFPKTLNIEVLKKSFEYVFAHHTILRSSFLYGELSIPVQRVHQQVDLPFECLDFSAFKEEEQKEKIEQFLKNDLEKGFDFKQAPLVRLTLIKTIEGTYKMVWTSHHILLDGWSMPIIMEEFLEAYAHYDAGKIPATKKEDQYEDYIKYIKSGDPFEEEQFWKTYLKGFNSPALLPFLEKNVDRNQGGQIFREESLVFDEATTEGIKAFAKANNLTVNTIVQGVWSFLLSKYTGQTDTVFGVTVSGRPSDMEDAEQKVGLYINTLPFRSSMGKEQTVIEWLTTIQAGHISAREYQYSSLSKVQSWTGIIGDFFDSILVFENYPMNEVLENNAALKIENIQIEIATTYLLSISSQLNQELHLLFSYFEDLLDPQYVSLITEKRTSDPSGSSSIR